MTRKARAVSMGFPSTCVDYAQIRDYFLYVGLAEPSPRTGSKYGYAVKTFDRSCVVEQ